MQAQSHQCRLYPSAREPPPQSSTRSRHRQCCQRLTPISHILADDHDDLRHSRPRSRVSAQRGSSPVLEVPNKQQRLSWEATQPHSSPPFPPTKHQGSSPSPPPPVRQYKPSTSTSTIARPPSPVQVQAQDQVSRTGKHKAKPLAPEPTQSELLAREEIRVLRQELIKARTMNISQGSFGPGGSTSALQSRKPQPPSSLFLLFNRTVAEWRGVQVQSCPPNWHGGVHPLRTRIRKQDDIRPLSLRATVRKNRILYQASAREGLVLRPCFDFCVPPF